MEIDTSGDENKLDSELLIHFPQGLIGFEQLKDYKLYSSETEENLHWLQPVEDETIEFAVTFPQVFQIDYEISLNDDEEQLLDIDDAKEIALLVTLSKKDTPLDDGTQLNANFMAPIVINTKKRLGLQKILNKQINPVTITMKG